MAEAASDQGCSCGGVLHSGRYWRKARGLPTGLDKEAYGWRFSFCCAVDGCRRRMTPPSLRFLRRRVYVATDGGADLSDAARRNTPASGAVVAPFGSIAANRCPLAGMVAHGICAEPLLASSASAAHAAGRPGEPAHVPAWAICWWRRRTTPGVAGFSCANHRRNRQAPLVTVFVDPQKTRLVCSEDVFYRHTPSTKTGCVVWQANKVCESMSSSLA
jgi:hypothetical protein